MNIKKIIDICKKSGTLIIFEGKDGLQWIGDGAAFYPLYNLPNFDTESICRAYDITEKQAAKMHFRDEPLPDVLNFQDTHPDEIQCEREEALFGGGYGITPIITSEGMLFINGRYLLPIAGAADEMLYIFERKTKDGQIYFAVKQGFMLIALIWPFDCINEKFVKRLKSISEQCEITLKRKQEAEK